MELSDARVARLLFLCFSTISLVCFSIPIFSAPADIVWADDFSGRTLDDWIITRGAFSADLGTLWASGTEALISNRAYHESDVEVGRWSFDILLREEWHWAYHPPTVRFMVDSLDDLQWQGYIIDFYTVHRMEGDIFSVHLRKHTDTWEFISRYDYDKPANGWQHVDILRSIDGRIMISLNRTNLIDIADTSIETSNYFLFDTEDCAETMIDPATRSTIFVEARESPMLDNIIVVELVPNEIGPLSVIFVVVSSSLAGIVFLLYVKKTLDGKSCLHRFIVPK